MTGLAAMTPELAEAPVARTVDLCGKVVPQTLIEARDLLHGLGPGEVLELRCDDAASCEFEIPNWCSKRSYAFLIAEAGAGVWTVRVRRDA